MALWEESSLCHSGCFHSPRPIEPLIVHTRTGEPVAAGQSPARQGLRKRFVTTEEARARGRSPAWHSLSDRLPRPVGAQSSVCCSTSKCMIFLTIPGLRFWNSPPSFPVPLDMENHCRAYEGPKNLALLNIWEQNFQNSVISKRYHVSEKLKWVISWNLFEMPGCQWLSV